MVVLERHVEIRLVVLARELHAGRLRRDARLVLPEHRAVPDCRVLKYRERGKR